MIKIKHKRHKNDNGNGNVGMFARNAQRIRNHKKRGEKYILNADRLVHRPLKIKWSPALSPSYLPACLPALIACLTKQKIHTHILTDFEPGNADKIRNSNQNRQHSSVYCCCVCVCVCFLLFNKFIITFAIKNIRQHCTHALKKKRSCFSPALHQPAI